MTGQPGILGWDIGGANLKAARWEPGTPRSTCKSLCVPFEIQYERSRLAPTLRSLAAQLGARPEDEHAVTMTAELSQAFRTKQHGVEYVLDALEGAFPAGHLHVYTVEGRFVSPSEARETPLGVAASNWAATCRCVARWFPTCILMDTGTTTTDITPVTGGELASLGWNDAERLRWGELVYTGAIRTPVEAVVQHVPLWGGSAGVSAEGFALMGDVYIWLNELREEDYSCRTPDGRPATRLFAAERLARVVCADRTMADDGAIQSIAQAVATAQVERIGKSLGFVLGRHPRISTAVTTGVGSFIASRAAHAAGLSVVSLSSTIPAAAQATPAAAAAALLHHHLEQVHGVGQRA
jgi:(4-(4-[2-(gamma-L-glutamylamino)ethyl]phenoxymethyl)furan-2-yl)methanamine synthase